MKTSAILVEMNFTYVILIEYSFENHLLKHVSKIVSSHTPSVLLVVPLNALLGNL